jgi:hypothetical protein
MLRRRGDGASGGLDVVLDVSKVPAPEDTRTRNVLAKSKEKRGRSNTPITTNKPPAGRAVLTAREMVLMPSSNGTLI